MASLLKDAKSSRFTSSKFSPGLQIPDLRLAVKRWSVGVVAFLLSAASAYLALPLPPAMLGYHRAPRPVVLDARGPAEYSIEAGERHLYRAELAEGETLRLEVDQARADLVVRLIDPSGRVTAVVDNPYETRRPEPIVLLGGSAGASTFEIEPFGPVPPDASYQLRLVAPAGPARELDRAAFNAARELSRAKDAMSRQELPRAVASLTAAVEGFELDADRLREAESRQTLGEVMLKLGPTAATSERAALELEAAFDLYRLLEPRECAVEAGLLNYLSEARLRAGRLGPARDAAAAALIAAEQSSQSRAARIALGRLAVTSRDLGEPVEAEDWAHRWLERAQADQALGDQLRALVVLESIAFQRGDYEACRDRASDLAALAGPELPFFQAVAALANGRVAYRTRAYGAAVGSLERSEALLALLPAEEAVRELAMVRSWLGLAHSALGNHPAALAKAEEAVSQWRELDEPSEVAAALFNQGIVLAEAGQAALSLAKCAQAGEIYERLGTAPGQASALLCQARALAEQGDLRQALGLAEQSVACVESLWEELEGVGQGLFYRQSKASYYETLIDILMQFGVAESNNRYAARALEVSEQTHFRSLLASLTALRNGLRRQVDPSLADASSRLRRRLSVLRQDLAAACFPERLPPGENERIAKMTRELESARVELAKVERDIGRRSRRYEALTQPRLLGLVEIQALLDAESQLLVFALGEKRSYAWLVSRQSWLSRQLAPRAEIARLAETGARHAAESVDPLHQHQAQVELKQLAERILQPFAGHLTARRLVVVPDGALQYVPFAALPLPVEPTAESGEPRLLLERHELVVLPSASVLAVLRELKGRRQRPTPIELALVGDPVIATDDHRFGAAPPRVSSEDTTRQLPGTLRERLLYAGQEIEAIEKLLPAKTVLTLRGFDAQRQSLLAGAVGEARILHFATHAWVDDRNPERSIIALSHFDQAGRQTSGSLALADVYSLDLAAELVVLSACQTGLGRQVEGEGLLSFTRGFMYAGVPSAVVSLWNVNDQATAELMRRFYGYLFERRLAPPAALRAAQLSMLEDPQWRRFAYWAAFTLHGDWR